MHSKSISRQVYALTALTLATWLSSGCVGGGGGGGVVYGGDPWIQDDVVVEGGGAGWYGRGHDDHGGGGGYAHPDGGHAQASHSAPAAHASVNVGGGARGPERH
jgi:hypothetical protein